MRESSLRSHIFGYAVLLLPCMHVVVVLCGHGLKGVTGSTEASGILAGGSSPASWGLAENSGGRRWGACWELEEGMCRRHPMGPLGRAPHCQLCPCVPVGMSLCPAPAAAPAQGRVWGSGLPTALGAGLFLPGGLGDGE